MKKIIFAIVSLFCAINFVSCQKEGASGASSVSEDTTKVETVVDENADDVEAHDTLSVDGVAMGGAMNSILVEDADDKSYDFAYPDLNRDSIDAWEDGDLVKIKYIPSKDGDVVISVRKLE